MRNGQNKRMRGRNNHRKNHNPMVRVYESNGPDVKIRGNPSHIAEKYIQLARDAQTSGDPIAAENYYQHAEHYYRVIAVAQEQFRQNNPNFARDQNEMQGARDDGFDDGDDDGQPMGGVRRFTVWYARAAALHPARRTTLSAAAATPASTSPARQRAPPKAMSSGCRPSSPAGNSRSSISLTKASSRARTVTTTSPTVSRCTAGAGGIAARAPTFRAAVTAETSRPRASDRGHRV